MNPVLETTPRMLEMFGPPPKVLDSEVLHAINVSFQPSRDSDRFHRAVVGQLSATEFYWIPLNSL